MYNNTTLVSEDVDNFSLWEHEWDNIGKDEKMKSRLCK